MPARAVAFMSFAFLLISKLFSSRLSTRQKNAINRQKKRDPLPLLTSLFFNFLLLEGVAGLWLLLSGGGLSHNLRSASFCLSVYLSVFRSSLFCTFAQINTGPTGRHTQNATTTWSRQQQKSFFVV
jgi:hypothetical protein